MAVPSKSIFTTSPGRLLFNKIIPQEFREDIGPDVPVDAKISKMVLERIAKDKPELYKDASFNLMRLGGRGSIETETSFSLDDLQAPFDKKKMMEDAGAQEDSIFANQELDPQQKKLELIKLYAKFSAETPELTYQGGIARGSNLAKMVASGARGSKGQLNSNIGADWLMLDSQDRPVPIPIKHSYSEGFSPEEYFAAAFGARKGTVSTKLNTPQGGFLSKQLIQAADDLVVTEEDCGAKGGLPSTVDDQGNIGALLSRPAGGFPSGTPITGNILRQMKDNNVSKLLVRSPITCQAAQGICAKCAGVREFGRLPKLMEHIGTAASSSLGEPLAQGSLSAKHCLLEGTRVRMADLSVKEIQDILPGEWVLGSDIHGYAFPVQVKAIWSQGTQAVWKFTFKSKGCETKVELFSTTEHQILGGDLYYFGKPTKVQAGLARLAFVSDGPEILRFNKIDEEFYKEAQCWDLSVDHPDELFVLENGLIVKNTGGVASASKPVGFPQINALFQIPKTYPDGATAAKMDGNITKIEPAPQGGNFVYIGDEQHYIPTDRTVSVRIGDEVEAGDTLSDGTLNPADVVEHKGIGAGRKYFLDTLQSTLKSAGISNQRRNLEILARAAINHVKIDSDEGVGNFLPDDIVQFSAIQKQMTPEISNFIPTSKAAGKYLQSPALHFTPGTRITPKVQKVLQDNDEFEVDVADKESHFRPEMVRLMEHPSYKPDWMAQLSGSYLKRNLVDEAHSGVSTSDIHGVYPGPGMAAGTEFGKSPAGRVGY